MIICIENPETMQKCKNISVKNITASCHDQLSFYLRSQFEISCIDATAHAVIEVAKSFGMIDFAKELNAELSAMTGREAIV